MRSILARSDAALSGSVDILKVLLARVLISILGLFQVEPSPDDAGISHGVTKAPPLKRRATTAAPRLRRPADERAFSVDQEIDQTCAKVARRACTADNLAADLSITDRPSFLSRS